MNTSWQGIRFICHQEAFVGNAYRDGGTDEKPRYSIGFGSQLPEVRPGDTILIEEAMARMRLHVAKNDEWLSPRILVPMAQHERNAVSSLVYQKWKAGPSILARINAYDPLWPEEFGLWTDNKRGLAHRRAREHLLAYDAYYGDIEHYSVWAGDPPHFVEMKEFPHEV